jgi:DNA-binding transcriptional MerR regulator
VLHIKSLLYDEGYTISGARQVIKSEQRQKAPQLALDIEETGPAGSTKQLRKLQKEMRELLAVLSKPPARSTVQSIRPSRSSASGRRPATEELFTPKPEL